MRDLLDIMEAAFTKYPGSVVYDDWTEFGARLERALAEASDEQQLCAITGLDYGLFSSVIEKSIAAWRDATSKSLLHGTTNEDGLPRAGTQIFTNLLWQTRFLLKAQDHAGLKCVRIRNDEFFKHSSGDLPMNCKPFLVVMGEWAQSTRDITALNDLLRMIYAYRRFTSSRPIKKLPKTIYRGVRANDLWKHADLSDIMEIIWKKDLTHQMKRKEAIDTLIAFIIKHGMNTISDGRILSFSGAKPVAERFANKTGFVIQLDPSKVEIVSSELHDSMRVGGADPYTGKNEREYIVRIPDGFKWSRDNFVISDLDYFVAEVNPLCVALLDHDDKEASYKMNGVRVSAQFYWNTSGTGGSVKYQSGDDWMPYGRTQFKALFGVDPLPTEKNLSSITDFKISERRRW